MRAYHRLASSPLPQQLTAASRRVLTVELIVDAGCIIRPNASPGGTGLTDAAST